MRHEEIARLLRYSHRAGSPPICHDNTPHFRNSPVPDMKNASQGYANCLTPWRTDHLNSLRTEGNPIMRQCHWPSGAPHERSPIRSFIMRHACGSNLTPTVFVRQKEATRDSPHAQRSSSSNVDRLFWARASGITFLNFAFRKPMIRRS